MKIKVYERDIDECMEKLYKILKEYNCYVVYDEELKSCIIVDKDNLEFEVI